MKKILWTLILTGTITNFVTAQNQPYFRVGDTIRGRDSIYHYQWWSEQWLSDPMHHLNIRAAVEDTHFLGRWDNNYLHYNVNTGNGVILRYCYTDQPLKIVGIASSCIMFNVHTINLVDRPSIRPEYLELWDADTGRNAFNRLAQIEWDHAQPKRYMEVNTRYSVLQDYFFECCQDTPPTDHIFYIPIREFYFEKPITVQDSFYVGHTANSQHPNIGGICEETFPNPETNGDYWGLLSIGLAPRCFGDFQTAIGPPIA